MVQKSYQSQRIKHLNLSPSYQSQRKNKYIIKISSSYQSQKGKRYLILYPSYQSQKPIKVIKIGKVYYPAKKSILNQIISSSAYPKKPKISLAYPKKFITQLKQKEINIKRKTEIKKELKKLSPYEKDLIKNQVVKNEPDYKIIKEFDKSKQKQVLKEIKKSKNEIKKERLKNVNDKFKAVGKNCKFNYVTQHHTGYKFEQKVNYLIYEGILNTLVIDIIKDIQYVLDNLHSKVNCNQRINYTSLEYTITLVDNTTDDSKISTNVSGEFGITDFKNMINQIPDIVFYLVNLVHQSQSSKTIEIYNVIYVNYDFKYNLER